MSEALNSPQAKRRRFRPYPKYKNSGVDWLGEIPDHWNALRLKRICTFAYGDSLGSEDRTEGEIEVFGSNGSIGTHDRANTLAPCLVIGRKGSFGKANFSRDPVFAIDTTFYVDSRFSDANLRWLYYVIINARLDLTTKDSAIPGLDREEAYSRIEPFCAPAEQCVIANFLDRETAKIDALIDKKKRLIELLQEKRTTLITQAVTKGLDPNVPMKDSGVEWLGKIPAHWEAFRMKFLVKEQLKYGANEAAESLDVDLPRYVRITDISEDGLLQEETFRSLPFEIAAPYLLEEGDILFARSGATVGKTFCYNPSWGVAAYAGYLIRARLDKSRIDPRFILYFTRSTLYWDWIRRNFIQATIQNVSAERYANLIIPSPPQMDQYAIMKYLDQETEKMDTLMTKIHKAIDRLKEYRAALISAAVTGRIDVRDENV